MKTKHLTKRQYQACRTVAARWLAYCRRRGRGHSRDGSKLLCSRCLEDALMEMHRVALKKQGLPKFEWGK